MDILKRAHFTRARVNKSIRQNYQELIRSDDSNITKNDQYLLSSFEMLDRIDAWRKYGCKEFHLNDGLIDAFKDTDIPDNVTIQQVPRPFKSFAISSDNNFLRFPELNSGIVSGTAIHTLIYIEDSLLIDHELYEFFNREGSIGALLILSNVGSQYLGCATIHIMEESPLNDLHNMGLISKTWGDKTNLQGIIHASVNLFCNTILYVNDNSRITNDTERHVYKKQKKPGGGYDRRHYIYLNMPRSHGDTSGSRCVNKRFLVRGHWRWQPYGRGRTLRFHKWIPPYWKGPSTAELVSNPHKVK